VPAANCFRTRSYAMPMSEKFSWVLLQALACGKLTVQEAIAQSERLEEVAGKAPKGGARVDEMYAQWQGMPDGAEKEALRQRLLAELSRRDGRLPDEDAKGRMFTPHTSELPVREIKHKRDCHGRAARVARGVKIGGKTYGPLQRVEPAETGRYRPIRPKPAGFALWWFAPTARPAALPTRPDPVPVLPVPAFRPYQLWLRLRDNEQGQAGSVVNPPCPEPLLYGSPRWALEGLSTRVVYERKRVLCKTTANNYRKTLRRSCRAIGVVRFSKNGRAQHYLAKMRTVPVEMPADDAHKQATAAVATVLRRFGYEV
jgi:hypothetical protein